MTKLPWTDRDVDDPDAMAAPEGARRARHEQMIDMATALFAASGLDGLDLRGLADGIGVSLRVVSTHFKSVDDVLAQSLAYYLRGLVPAVLAVAMGAPARRCFLENTRTADGGYTGAHEVWVRYKWYLPPKLRLQLDQYYQQLAPWVAWPDGNEAAAMRILRYLDKPGLTVAVMEAEYGRVGAGSRAPVGHMAAAKARAAEAPLCERKPGGTRAEYYENLLRSHRGTLHAPFR